MTHSPLLAVLVRRGVPLLLLAGAASCTTPPPRRPVVSLAEMRHATVVMQRWDLSCGAAAIATLLTYDLGDAVTERAAAEAMLGRTDPLQVRVQGGFSLLDLQEYAQSLGYEAEGYRLVSLDDLVAMAPAIIPIDAHGYDHFVVFRGVRRDRVLLADPAFGRRAMPNATFVRAWKLKVAFVVVRRSPR
jgi:predicted double-glycine peptidase